MQWLKIQIKFWCEPFFIRLFPRLSLKRNKLKQKSPQMDTKQDIPRTQQKFIYQRSPIRLLWNMYLYKYIYFIFLVEYFFKSEV